MWGDGEFVDRKDFLEVHYLRPSLCCAFFCVLILRCTIESYV